MKFIALLLIVVSSTLSAENKKCVVFLEPVGVAGITLDAGEYVVEWEGQGSTVQVSFRRGNSKLVSVSAQLREVSHPCDAVTVRPRTPGPDLLIEIDFPSLELRFVNDDSATH